MENKKLKCVLYARVSTKNESQAESCEHQVMLCDDYLEKHPQYELIGCYVDDGISGKNDNRKEYTKMIRRVSKGDIDYIFTKDCDRLCRSTEVNGKLNQILVQSNTLVLYLGDGSIYNPSKRTDRMLNNFKAIMGEDYVLMQSEKARIYHSQKCKNKIINANNVVFGYKWDYENKRLVVNEDEAKVVRLIYELYVYQDMGVNDISRYLYNRGIVGVRNKNPLSTKVLNKILTNEAYVGTLYFNKRRTVDIGMGSGRNAKSRRIELPKEEWVGVPCPRIFEDDDLFNLAQKIRQERNHTYNVAHSKEESRSYFSGTHLFSSKVFCGSCGMQYQYGYMGRTKDYPIYKDVFGKKNKLPSKKCNNKNYNKVFESTLINITKNGFNMLIENKEEIFSSIYSILEETLRESNIDTSYVDELNNKIEKLNKQKETIMNKWLIAPSQDVMDFCMEQKEKRDREIAAIEDKIKEQNEKENELGDVTSRLREIKECLDALCDIQTIDRQFVKCMVDKITINEDGKLYITFKFSNQKLVATIKAFNEAKQAIRDGLPLIHKYRTYIYKRLEEVKKICNFVGTIVLPGMMADYLPPMEIQAEIFSPVWK